MTSVQIVSGTVEYTKPSNYQANIAGAKVTLTFGAAEGVTHDEAVAMLDEVCRLAVRKAVEMANGPAASGGGLISESESVELSRKLLEVGKSVQEDVAARAAEIATLQRAFDAQSNLPSPAAIAPLGVVASALPAGQPIVIPPMQQPVQITDSDVVKAVTDKVAAMLKEVPEAEREHVPVRVGKLLAHFAPPPAKCQTIPQESRALFLKYLAELTLSGPLPFE